MYLVRIADGYESLDGETEHEHWSEILCHEIDESVELADDRIVDGAQLPGVLELLQDV